MVPLVRPFMKSPARGAETSIYLASSSDVADVSGRYFANSRPKSSSRASRDAAAAARLWEVSGRLVGLPSADRA